MVIVVSKSSNCLDSQIAMDRTINNSEDNFIIKWFRNVKLAVPPKLQSYILEIVMYLFIFYQFFFFVHFLNIKYFILKQVSIIT